MFKQICFPPLPVLTVDYLEVHVDSGDEHLTVDANLVDGGWREGVSHHHQPHDLIGHRTAVRQCHSDAQTPRDVDHLTRQEKTDRGQDRKRDTRFKVTDMQTW